DGTVHFQTPKSPKKGADFIYVLYNHRYIMQEFF
ncbi:hypothetical protein E9G_07154, partial [Moraxella catarrhalis 7169]